MATLGELMGANKKSQKGATEIYGKSKNPDSRPHGPVRRLGTEYTPGTDDGPSQDFDKLHILELQEYWVAHKWAGGSAWSESLTFESIITNNTTNLLNQPNNNYSVIKDLTFDKQLGISDYSSKADGLLLADIEATVVSDITDPDTGEVIGKLESQDNVTTATRALTRESNRYYDHSAIDETDTFTYITADGKFSSRGTFYDQTGNLGNYVVVETDTSLNTARYNRASSYYLMPWYQESKVSVVGGDGAKELSPQGGKLYTVLDMRTRVLRSLVEGTGTLHKDLAPEDVAFTLPNVESALLADLNALIPGQTQMGFGKVPIGDMFIPPADYYGLSSNDDADYSNAEYDTGGVSEDNYAPSFSTHSYGHLNSPLEKFAGALPMGMILPAIMGAIAVIVVALLIELLVSIMDMFGASESAADYGIDPFKPWMHAKGSFRNPADKPMWILQQVLTAMGWPSHLKYDFAKNVQRGIKVFYGMAPEDDGVLMDDWQELFDMMIILIESPGFYTVIIKRVVADVEQIGDAFANFNPSPLGGISSIFEILTAIGSSTTFRFLVRMSEVGEQAAIYMYENGINHGPGATSSESDPLSAQNRLYLTRFENNGSRKSPTSLSAYGSLFLAGQAFWDPGEMIQQKDATAKKLKDFPGHKTVSIRNDDGGEGFNSMISARIPIEIVKYYEERLHADYMPFTIQDLRNNEIVNLPAFIESVDDSFAVDYATTEAYGRTDPVKIWNKTTRTINVSFKLVAHSEDDHDHMYYIINRLTSMLYPQRNVGRLLGTGPKMTRQAVAPFSQVPIGTPVVRLRLGELIHSNYSNNAFGRLIGHPGALDLGENDEASQATPSQRYATAIAVRIAKKEWQNELLFGDKGKTSSDKLLELQPKTKVIVPAGAKIALIEAPKEDTGALGAIAAAALGAGGDVEMAPIFFNAPIDLKCEVMQVEKIARYKGEFIKPAEAASRAADPEEKDKLTYQNFIVFKVGYWDDEKADKDKKAMEEIRKIFGGLVAWGMGLLKEEGRGAALMMECTRDNHPILVPKAEDISVRIRGAGGDPDVYKGLNTKTSTSDSGAVKVMSNAVHDYIQGHPAGIAMRQNAGRGMAGVITQMSLDYSDATWRTDPGSRAPLMATINLAFSPMHDLTPGIDTYGRMMAPTHPVGKFNSDPHSRELSSYDPFGGADKWEKIMLEQPDPKEDKKPSGLLGALGL